MIKATTRVLCLGGECTHYLVLRIPVRQGKPADRRQKAPVTANYDLTVAPVIEALGTVVSAAEYREIKKAVDRILRD